MIPYHYLDIPDFQNITHKLYKFVRKVDFDHLQLQFFNRYRLQNILEEIPELVDIFKDLQIETKHGSMAIVKVKPTWPITPHVDVPRGTKVVWALNWPIANCEETFTTFYKIKSGEYVEQYLDNGERYFFFKDEDVEEEYRIKINKPTMIKVDVPHCVINPTQRTRYTASFRFVEDPLHLLER